MPTDPADIALTPAEIAAATTVRPAVLLLMGVSGAGKTTVALRLQHLLGWPFQEGDDLHPAVNVEKMRSGHPLNDEDRAPWLAAIARWIDARLAAGEAGIITCSNLKRAYRNITVGNRRGVVLVYLRGDASLIGERVSRRAHRYMPPALLQSQFETLEEPEPDEHAVVVTVASSPEVTVLHLLQALAVHQSAHPS